MKVIEFAVAANEMTETEKLKILESIDDNKNWVDENLSKIQNWFENQEITTTPITTPSTPITTPSTSPTTQSTPLTTESTTSGSASLIASFSVVIISAISKTLL